MQLREAHMTREEKQRAEDAVLAKYGAVGATVVSDDSILCRLLQGLQFSAADKDVVDYLCSYLVA
jgi:hypothetical protein